jgi:hypothetical protein
MVEGGFADFPDGARQGVWGLVAHIITQHTWAGEPHLFSGAIRQQVGCAD